MTRPKLQSSLGIVSENSNRKNRSWENWSLAIGEVVKVHHKRYTADVKFYDSGWTVMSSSSNEGVNSCRISTRNAGYDSKLGKAFGEVIPIQKGSIVLVGFTGNQSRKPVILGVLHDNSEGIGVPNPHNVLPSAYPIDYDEDMYRYLNVNRIQDFITVDGFGNFEVSSHTKAFIKAINSRDIDEETFDYNDLSVRDTSGNVVSAPEEYSHPMKYLAVFRQEFSDIVRDSLRFIVDASKTAFRIAKIQRSDSKLSMLNISESGEIQVRRQLDSSSWKGSSSEYTDVSIKDDGSIKVSLVSGGKTTQLDIALGSGISITTEDPITVSTASDIKLNSDVEVQGNLTVTGHLEHGSCSCE